VAAFAYGVSATGQRTNCVETVNGSARSYVWQYDVLRRLTNELISVGGGSPGSVGYQLDGVGNRLQRSSSLPSIPSQSLSYSSNDWVRGDGYDNNGNTQSSGAVTYQYDYANRLTNAGVIQFTYDAEGNRVSKTSAGVTTLYLVDEHNPTGYPQVVEESTVQGGVTNLARVYTYGLALISQRQGSTVYFLGADGHGSTRFLMNGSGRVINTFAYDSYGNLISSSATPQTAYLYCGEQWDGDLGMYYQRARYYKPDTGRFWSMDSYEGNNEEPLSLHKYLYGAADPVNFFDPSGNEYTLAGISVSTAINSALTSMAIGAPFRAYKAAKQFEAGVALGDIAFDAAAGIALDGAIGAALPGLFSIGSRIAPIARITQVGGQVVGRAANSVWNLTAIARGRMIAQTILGRLPSTLALGVKNFPVIDDLYQGVATSIKSIDLLAKTYQNTATLVNKILADAAKLAEFQGATLGKVTFTAGQIQERVLVVAVEEGAATTAQAQALVQAARQAHAGYPGVTVVVKAVP